MSEEQGWIMCKEVIQLWYDRMKRQWPKAVMECAQCLAYMVLNGSRMTSDGLIISYHVIYPWLVFPCKTDMILRDEVGSMNELEQFQYSTRNGTLKSFMNPAVYTSNRQFRMLPCHKPLDNSRTVLRLNSSPTLQKFVRSCITQIDTRAW
jgi:hypothetical protein